MSGSIIWRGQELQRAKLEQTENVAAQARHLRFRQEGCEPGGAAGAFASSAR